LASHPLTGVSDVAEYEEKRLEAAQKHLEEIQKLDEQVASQIIPVVPLRVLKAFGDCRFQGFGVKGIFCVADL
jgi:hypothetical protein